MVGLNQVNALRMLTVALGLGFLAGCAGYPEQKADAATVSQASASGIYQWRVEQAARDQKVNVIWVNPPRSGSRQTLNNAFEQEIQLRTPAKPVNPDESDDQANGNP